MNTAKDESHGAVAGQVDRGVRPSAEARQLAERLRLAAPHMTHECDRAVFRAAADELERLHAAGQKLVDAYRDRYRKRSNHGLRADAPLRQEFAEFNAALNAKA